MSKQYTYEQIASDIELWKEYVDTDATMTDEEYATMTVQERIQLQVELFGPEEDKSTDE